MTRYFADTFYFLALLNRDDGAHEEVRAFTAGFAGAITTTDWILIEVADAMSGINDRDLFLEFLSFFRSRRHVKIIRASAEWFGRGVAFYARRSDKESSLNDCISFLVMRDEHLTGALTGDHHFAQAGFTALFRTK